MSSDDSSSELALGDESVPDGDGSTTDTPVDTPTDTPTTEENKTKNYVDFLKSNWLLVLIFAIGLLALAYGIHDDTNGVIIAIGIILAAVSAVCFYAAYADINIIASISNWFSSLTNGGSKDAA